MESVTKLFKTSAFGFNRSDVINYIEKTRNDFYDYKMQTQRTIDDLNEKIKELEEALISKNADASEVKSTESIDFSSSVSQINEAADHLRETADKICDDIGDFLDKFLTADRDAFTEDIFFSEDFDAESILNQDVSDEDFLTEDEIADAIMKFDCETEDNISLFSQIIDNAVIPKNETVKSETVAENTKPSILDGLLGSSLYSV